MKKFWFSLLAFGNALFLLINVWKMAFTYYPGFLVGFGAFVALANLLTMAPALLATFKSAPAEDAA